MPNSSAPSSDPPAADAEVQYRGQFLHQVRQGRWEYAVRVHGSTVAVIIPVTAAGELVLVEQYRIPIGQRTIELPAGLVGDVAEFSDESPLQGAARELEEETGYRPAEMRFLLRTPTSSGLTNETAWFYLAQGLSKVSEGGGDETEDIDVHVIPIAQLGLWLKRQYQRGKAVDPKIYAALYWLQDPDIVTMDE